jgi:hypothetical protein
MCRRAEPDAFLRGTEAMPITFACGSCGARLRGPANLAGRATICPKCKASVKVKAPAPRTLDDVAAAILSGPEADRPAAAPRQPHPGGKRPVPATGRPRRPSPREGTREGESKKAERSIQVLLQLAEARGEKVAYLVALDFLTDVNRCAANRSLSRETAARLRERFTNDNGQESHVRNILLAGGAHIPPGSTLTLRQAYGLFCTIHDGP